MSCRTSRRRNRESAAVTTFGFSRSGEVLSSPIDLTETFVIAEPGEGGILIRRAVVLPVEVYTPERKAQFLLSNAVNAADYAGAVAEVRRMGLDPEKLPDYKPPGA